MGNFQYFVKWKAGFDLILKICAKNDTYLPPQSQNNVIHCCAEEIRDIITRHFNNIGFVGENLEVNEAYLGFVELSRTDALTITKNHSIKKVFIVFYTREKHFRKCHTFRFMQIRQNFTRFCFIWL